MRFKVMPRWFKQTIAIAGLLLALPGIFVGLGVLCSVLILIIDSDTAAVYVGLIGFTLMMLMAGTGGVTFWHSMASLNEKVSKPLRLPPLGGLGGIFALYFVIGVVIYQNDFVTGLFLPPILLMGATVPSLMAVLWFSGGQMESLTWRRGILAFAGTATLSLFIFIILQFIILAITSMLNPYPGEAIVDTLEVVFEGLFERNGISRMIDRRFAYIFVQITIIIPLIAALAKPLVTLPLLEQLSRRETFLLGALAGAGFAIVENVVYMNYEIHVWPWILIFQALGGAIHPLGAGLVALGWQEVVRYKRNAWPNWLACFGIAAALHSLWSLGFLVIISLLGNGASTFIRWNGATASLILVSLIGLAVGTPWVGRSIGQQLGEVSDALKSESANNRRTLFDRGVAIWALASLVMILSAGIIALQALLK